MNRLCVGAVALVALAVTQPETETLTGTGFILTSSGYIATNHHVVAGAAKLEVRIPGRSTLVPAVVLVDDQENDLAIIKADGGALGSTPIAFADLAQVKPGQDTFVLGYPLGDVMGETVRLSVGSVSALAGIQDDPRVYQISNPIQPGNSGGPLFNKDGQLIGVVVSQLDAKTFLLNRGIIPQNINFAVKGALLKTLLQKLPEAPDVIRRTNKIAGTRDQQVETLSKWVVKIVNHRPTVTDAASEFRRSLAATMRVDVLGGKMAFYVDPAKWVEAPPKEPGDGQQFFLAKAEGKAGAFLEIDKSEIPLNTLRAAVLKRVQANVPDARIVAQERRIVNGIPMVTALIEGTPSGPNAPVTFVAQFYTGAEGSAQLVGFVDREHLKEFGPELNEFLSGFEKQKSPSIRSAPFLSEWTRRTIRRLNSPLLMRVYTHEADFGRYQSILTAYQDAAPGIFAEYVDPEKNAPLAKALGIQRAGTIDFDYKGQSVRAVADNETDITKALVRLASGPQKIYFTAVHSERDLTQADKEGYATVAAWMARNNFAAERLVPTADNTVPADAAAVIVAGPKRDFSANQVALLKKYLAAGGRVALLLDPPAKGGPALPNLVALAREWGIDVAGDKVRDTTGKGRLFGDGVGAGVATKPTAATPPDPNTVPETRLVVIGDSGFAANGSIDSPGNGGLFITLVDWISEPVPPADKAK